MRRAKMDYTFKYRAPIERRRIPQVPMPTKPWLPAGEKAPPVRKFTPEEIEAFVAEHNPVPPVVRNDTARWLNKPTRASQQRRRA